MQAAVDDFLRLRPGTRARPWERIFRLFRYGAIYLTGAEVTGTDTSTPTTSNCNGTCAQNWPPVKGPATASGVTGTFGTIKRSDGSAQATFDGHPLYTFAGDTAPGQAKGNGLNAAGGLWHEITTSGAAAPAGSSSPGGGGYGY